MYLNRIILTVLIMVSFLFVSCSDDVTDPIDDGNNNTNDSLTFDSYSFTGKIQLIDLMSVKFVSWNGGAGKIEARINGSRSSVVGTGVLNSDGTFTMNMATKISKTPITVFNSTINGNLSFSPNTLGMIPSISFVTIVGSVEKTVQCAVFSNLNPVESWMPTVFNQSGTVTGTDYLGNTWDVSCNKGWAWLGVIYDNPSKGKSKNVYSVNPNGSFIWYTYL